MGVYQSCSAQPEYFDNVNARFVYNHPDLRWVRTTGPQALNVPGAVKIAPHNEAAGLIDISYGNGSVYSTIGKAARNVLYYYRVGDPIEISTAGEFDVLACQACTNGGSGPCKFFFYL